MASSHTDADADLGDAATGTSRMDIYLKYMLHREKYQVPLGVEKAKTSAVNEDVATNSPEADGNSETFAHNDNQVIESAEGNAGADADAADTTTNHMDIYLKYMLYREKYQVYLDVEKAKTYTVT